MSVVVGNRMTRIIVHLAVEWGEEEGESARRPRPDQKIKCEFSVGKCKYVLLVSLGEADISITSLAGVGTGGHPKETNVKSTPKRHVSFDLEAPLGAIRAPGRPPSLFLGRAQTRGTVANLERHVANEPSSSSSGVDLKGPTCIRIGGDIRKSGMAWSARPSSSSAGVDLKGRHMHQKRETYHRR